MPPKNFEEYTISYGVGHQETKTWVATSEDRLNISDFGLDNWTLTVNNNDWMTIPISELNTSCTITSLYEPRPLRLHCEYCGCVSSKDFGTCEHCGAPLVPME